MGAKAQTFSGDIFDAKNVKAGVIVVRADSIKKSNDILAI